VDPEWVRAFDGERLEMKCPHCGFVQSDRNTECSKCRTIFERDQIQSGANRKRSERSDRGRRKAGKRGDFFRKVVFHVEPGVNPFYFGGRVLVLLLLFVWGWKFILTPMEANYAGNSFLHFVNLPFHEAGHIFFQFLGRWMASLGGTLGQLLIPMVCLLVLLIKSRDPFGAAVTLWWLGESLLDIAPYINDARRQELLLLGGVTGKEADYGYHDWEYILREAGLLRYDHLLAHLADKIGALLILASLAWAGYILYRQYQNLNSTHLDA